jgi:hypothetical protein
MSLLASSPVRAGYGLGVACALAALGCGSPSGTHVGRGGEGLDASDGGPGDRETGPGRGNEAAADSGVEGGGPADGPADSGGPRDGATDAGDALAALEGCLGADKTLTVSGQMPYVDVPVGAEAGEFVLDFGSTFSSIDLSAFPAPGPTTSGCDPSDLGVICTVEDFAFFAAPGPVSLTTEDFSGVTGTVRQAGIIGTDFLSEHVMTLAYGAGLAFASPPGSFCSAAALQAAGFAPLTTKGFYDNDLSLLEPASDVDSSASSGTSVPNVPTVPVSIGGVGALAQLDTGFDDDVTPFSVNINKAFLAAVQAGAPAALVRDPSLDTSLTTCVSGVSEPVTGYRLAAPATFDFVTTGGVAARSYPNAALFAKDTPAAAHVCGGIGTWTVPAAQVAASYFNDMGVLVFDPYGATVWIPK